VWTNLEQRAEVSSDVVRKNNVNLRGVIREGRQHMGQFSFTTDTESEQYCRDIIAVLVSSYGLSQSEALRQINKWAGQNFVGMDLRYHKGGPEDWAKHIFHHWYPKDL
jgi:hypothetical protein